MVPTAFDEENLLLLPPPCMSAEECTPLSVHASQPPGGVALMISAWKPTKDELAEIQRTGRVWLIVYGGAHPPVALTGHHPFSPPPPEDACEGK